MRAALDEAFAIDPIGRRFDAQAAADYLTGALPQRSVVLMIGDFYETADWRWLGAKHECYAVVVRDRFEEYPLIDEPVELLDPVTKKGVVGSFDASRDDAWRRRIERRDREMFEAFERNRIGYTKIYTDEDPFFKLREMLK
jgi:hypothetical protein